MTARIHEWCGRLDDEAGLRCPCNANTVTVFEVEARLRAAIHVAKAKGWAGNAGDITRPRIIGQHFGRRRAA